MYWWTGLQASKTPRLSKSMNMDIWLVGAISTQLFIIGSSTETKFSEKKNVVTGKTLFSVIDPFCTAHSNCLNIGFWQSSFVCKCCILNLSTSSWKKGTLGFWKWFAFFRKFISKLKYCKRSKLPVIVA